MAAKTIKTPPLVVGTASEQAEFTKVQSHARMSREDLDLRITRKNGFDDADKMFASHIDEANWPFRSLIFDPRPYTVILEKSARLIGSKPKGRLVPREGGDTLGAYINNELLDFQWDDNSRLGESMIGKWIKMDQNTRKYGSAFALADWRYETRKTKDGKKKVFYDGPDFRVLNNRHVLANVAYDYLKDWFCYEDYVSLADMEAVNDYARGDPVYKNLTELADAIKNSDKSKGDVRDQLIQNKQIRGLQDYLGHDEYNKVIKVVCERRGDRWVKVAINHGVVIQDMPNPYDDGELHVVHLKYYTIDGDLYGVSELEPVSKLIKANNAHMSAFSDSVALQLRPPVHINPTNVRMHTIDWSPEAKWLMNSPNVDAQVMKMDPSLNTTFTTTYNTLVGSLMNALGEQSQQMSSVNPTQDAGRVTATEIKDTSFTRNVRDNMNKIFLSEALKQQIMFWYSMNRQFMFSAKADKLKIIRIVGRDAIEFFTRQGLSDVRPTQQDGMDVANAQALGIQPPDIQPGPRYAVPVGEDENGMPLEVPKYMPDEAGGGGNLIIEPGDLEGYYDYIPDIESMSAPSSQDIETKLQSLLVTLTNPVILQGLAAEQVRPKFKELIVKAMEATNVVKDADAYFEDLSNVQNPMMGGMQNGQVQQGAPGQVVPGGNPAAATGQMGQGALPAGGMAPSGVPTPGAGNPQFGGGPAQVYG